MVTLYYIPVRVVELGGPDDEGERLAHLVLGDVRPDVDVARVPVQLEVLVQRDNSGRLYFGWTSLLHGDQSARGLGYVDISSVSYRCYPERELRTT